MTVKIYMEQLSFTVLFMMLYIEFFVYYYGKDYIYMKPIPREFRKKINYKTNAEVATLNTVMQCLCFIYARIWMKIEPIPRPYVSYRVCVKSVLEKTKAYYNGTTLS